MPTTAIKGDKGDKGDSAYTIAVQDGYLGTQKQWLDSLHSHVNEFVFDNDSKVFISKNIGEFFYHLGKIPPIGAIHADGNEKDGTIYNLLYTYALNNDLVKTEAE
jgi:hypothetical protein